MWVKKTNFERTFRRSPLRLARKQAMAGVNTVGPVGPDHEVARQSEELQAPWMTNDEIERDMPLQVCTFEISSSFLLACFQKQPPFALQSPILLECVNVLCSSGKQNPTSRGSGKDPDSARKRTRTRSFAQRDRKVYYKTTTNGGKRWLW